MNLVYRSVGRPPFGRDAFNAWFVRHDIAWELTMAVLAIVYVAIGFIVDDLPENDQGGIALVEMVLTGIFIAEFSSRILAARDHKGYLRGHIVDVVTLMPPIRGARVLRLFRLFRLLRPLADVWLAIENVGAIARHRGFAMLIFAWLGVMAICSGAMYAFEHGTNPAVQTPFDALWWGVITLTTVGYGDIVPTTTEGRVAGMVLMLLGIILFGAITATITSIMIARANSQKIEEQREELRDERRAEKGHYEDEARHHKAEERHDRAEERLLTDEVQELHESYEHQGSQERMVMGVAGVGFSLSSEMERLAALHAAGSLTASEFRRAKSLLLGRHTA